MYIGEERSLRICTAKLSILKVILSYTYNIVNIKLPTHPTHQEEHDLAKSSLVFGQKWKTV